MKSLSLFRSLGLLALLIGLAAIPLHAQNQQTGSQDSATPSQAPSMTSQSNQGQVSQLFVGKIAKSKGDVLLKADAGVSYKLDNGDQAMQFVGKTVKVTGTLDTATNTIHVTNIEPPSS